MVRLELFSLMLMFLLLFLLLLLLVLKIFVFVFFSGSFVFYFLICCFFVSVCLFFVIFQCCIIDWYLIFFHFKGQRRRKRKVAKAKGREKPRSKERRKEKNDMTMGSFVFDLWYWKKNNGCCENTQTERLELAVITVHNPGDAHSLNFVMETKTFKM